MASRRVEPCGMEMVTSRGRSDEHAAGTSSSVSVAEARNGRVPGGYNFAELSLAMYSMSSLIRLTVFSNPGGLLDVLHEAWVKLLRFLPLLLRDDVFDVFRRYARSWICMHGHSWRDAARNRWWRSRRWRCLRWGGTLWWLAPMCCTLVMK